MMFLSDFHWFNLVFGVNIDSLAPQSFRITEKMLVGNIVTNFLILKQTIIILRTSAFLMLYSQDSCILNPILPLLGLLHLSDKTSIKNDQTEMYSAKKF